MWVPGDEGQGGAFDAAALAWPQGVVVGGCVGPRLDFGEGNHAGAPRHEVDLADPRFVARGKNAISLQTQKPGGQVFGEAPEAPRAPSFGCWLACHQSNLAKASARA